MGFSTSRLSNVAFTAWHHQIQLFNLLGFLPLHALHQYASMPFNTIRCHSTMSYIFGASNGQFCLFEILQERKSCMTHTSVSQIICKTCNIFQQCPHLKLKIPHHFSMSSAENRFLSQCMAGPQKPMNAFRTDSSVLPGRGDELGNLEDRN